MLLRAHAVIDGCSSAAITALEHQQMQPIYHTYWFVPDTHTLFFVFCARLQAPGGIGEMFLDGDAGKEFALIKGHKGFVRRAMAHGVPLVPVYGKNGVGVTVGRNGGRGGGGGGHSFIGMIAVQSENERNAKAAPFCRPASLFTSCLCPLTPFIVPQFSDECHGCYNYCASLVLGRNILVTLDEKWTSSGIAEPLRDNN